MIWSLIPHWYKWKEKPKDGMDMTGNYSVYYSGREVSLSVPLDFSVVSIVVVVALYCTEIVCRTENVELVNLYLKVSKPESCRCIVITVPYCASR